MRRLFFVLVLAAFAIGGAFAQVSVHISAGGGLVFDGGRIGGDSFSEQGFSQSLHMNASGFGGFFFLDMTYAELSIGLMTGPLRHHWELIGLGQNVRTSEGGYLLTRADISLLGKIPISVGSNNFVIFPLFGIGYNIVLSFTEDGNNALAGGPWSASDLNALRFKAGVGGDVEISSIMFFRASLLGYYRFPANFFRDMELLGYTARGGFGAIIRLGVGWRF